MARIARELTSENLDRLRLSLPYFIDRKTRSRLRCIRCSPTPGGILLRRPTLTAAGAIILAISLSNLRRPQALSPTSFRDHFLTLGLAGRTAVVSRCHEITVPSASLRCSRVLLAAYVTCPMRISESSSRFFCVSRLFLEPSSS